MEKCDISWVNPCSLVEDDLYWFRATVDVQTTGYSVTEYGDLDRYPLWRPLITYTITPFMVLSKTPKGVWLDTGDRKKFVLRDARKRFACPTRTEAVESLKARLTRRAFILGNQLKHTKLALDAMDSYR